jgi:predicted porin
MLRAALSALALIGAGAAAFGQQPAQDPATVSPDPVTASPDAATASPGAVTGPQGLVAGSTAPAGAAPGTLSITLAHEPPLEVPFRARLTLPPDVIAVDGWVLYPQVRVYGLGSDNLFLSPTTPVSVGGLGITPSLTAEWSNGIHTTTLYANVDRQIYPSDHAINTLDPQAGFKQKWEAMRDLIFEADGDYTHKTIAPSLTSAIPGTIPSQGTITLPNGNIQLPNGNIVSPTGQIVGQASPGLSVGTISVVNPYDQFTGTASVTKFLNGGVVKFSSSLSGTNYDTPTTATPDRSVWSFRGDGAFWLGPVFYVFSDGSLARTVSTTDTTAFRAIGGIGFKPTMLFGGSAYFGRQGSESTGTAGGELSGAQISYSPTPVWTLGLSVDKTINIASQAAQASPSTLALSLPETTPQSIALSSSTKITATSFQTRYLISPQWTASGTFAYTYIGYVGSTRVDNTWLADVLLTYALSRSMTLTWEYQYTDIASNAPLVSTKRNLVTMAAVYKF